MREHKEWDDTAIYMKAAAQGWPITDEQMQLCVDKLHMALETTMDAKTVAKLVDSFRQLYGQNQQERMAKDYFAPEDAQGRSRVLAPHEIANMMDQSIPQESTIESEESARPHTPLLSCSLPAPASSTVAGFGAGVGQPACAPLEEKRDV